VIALLQRVLRAHVEVDDEIVGSIGPGLLVILAVEPLDSPTDADACIDRLLRYRVFADVEGRMNLSLLDAGGGLLLVPQFTLAADTGKGLRPSFSSAASPELGESLFGVAVESARRRLGGKRVATGRFGAHMRVSLVNDGPVTFWLRMPTPARR
jgi:D-tyrosyl-tRNA(Tyr) deacylase